MNEYELLDLYAQYADIYGTRLEFLVGISMAFTVGAFMAARQLSRLAVVFGAGLYTIFCGFQITIIFASIRRLIALVDSLREVTGKEASVLPITEIIATSSLATFALPLVISLCLLLWAGTVGFAIQRHRGRI